MIFILDIRETKGTPIRNIQTMLRQISTIDSNIPVVIPDGIFGNSTKDAVIKFQETYGLTADGIIDLITFEEIVAKFQDAVEKNTLPRKTGLFKTSDTVILPNDENEHLHTIKSMLKNIATRFSNIDLIEINNIHNDESVLIVKEIQKLSGIPENGEINNVTLNIISYLYEIWVTGYLSP